MRQSMTYGSYRCYFLPCFALEGGGSLPVCSPWDFHGLMSRYSKRFVDDNEEHKESTQR